MGESYAPLVRVSSVALQQVWCAVLADFLSLEQGGRSLGGATPVIAPGRPEEPPLHPANGRPGSAAEGEWSP